ncbi:MAG TPA: hypothetical protein VMA13_03410 [Candidatus Saccharimonadales bacterium]|nr:hypothetical protein [Candidatus Saccharimonadales bacterium]
MDTTKIKSALADIAAEKDPTLKSLKMASLCSTLWAEYGVELVVVGGSAIEILTEGAYASGDLDLCYTNKATLSLRQRQEVMGLLGAKGGPRNWEVAGMFVDVLGAAESFARTPFRRVQGPYGEVRLMKPEDLLVERVLVSFYPEKSETARRCAKSFISVILRGGIIVDWREVRRLAKRPEYRNFQDCEELIKEVADELKIESPLHSDSD